jgi:hypothetical protein
VCENRQLTVRSIAEQTSTEKQLWKS